MLSEWPEPLTLIHINIQMHAKTCTPYVTLGLGDATLGTTFSIAKGSMVMYLWPVAATGAGAHLMWDAATPSANTWHLASECPNA